MYKRVDTDHEIILIFCDFFAGITDEIYHLLSFMAILYAIYFINLNMKFVNSSKGFITRNE